MSGEPAAGAASGQPTALSRELRDFLIQLSIALHRYGMYPEGHPSLAPTVDNVLGLATDLLTNKPTLSLGIARNQLVIEGVATDPKNPVLTELAARMHRHHLGAITLRRGVGHDEVHEFLHTVAQDPDRSGQPVGLDPRYREQVWPNLQLYALNYERLRMLGEEAQPEDETEDTRAKRTRAAQLWLGLARAALAAGHEPVGGDGGGGGGGGAQAAGQAEELADPDPTVVAQAINAHERDAAYDQVIVGYMLQIADELKSGQAPEAMGLKRKVSRMVSSLDQNTLGQLLAMGGDASQRRRFLLSAAEGMAVDAVVDLVQAAAQAHEQTISHSLLRMMQKLAHHAEAGSGRRQATADASVRAQIAGLIRDWSLRDPNPDAYRQALERMSTATPIFASSPEAQFLPEPRRMVEMALEVDVMGEAVQRAADSVILKGDLQWLLDRLKTAHAPTVVATLRSRYVTSTQVAAVLADEPLNLGLLDQLLEYVGIDATDALLDALIRAEASQTRRLLIDRLVKLGPAIGPRVVQRLDDERWYVTRNMLALLSELRTLPPGFDPASYTSHSDGRVRREALRMLLRDPATRDRAICIGLADTDDHAVRLALTASGRGCPEAAIPLLVTRAKSGSNADQRVTATRVLAGTDHPAALDALLALTAPRRTLLGVKPPPKSREYLAALAGLTRYSQDPRARDALAVAARSRDPEIAQAALGVTGEPGGA